MTANLKVALTPIELLFTNKPTQFNDNIPYSVAVDTISLNIPTLDIKFSGGLSSTIINELISIVKPVLINEIDSQVKSHIKTLVSSQLSPKVA